MIADQFLETKLWDLLWSRISQSLKPDQEKNSDDEQILDSEPDWTLLSPNGYFYLLQLASTMLTMSTQNCITLILKEDCILFDTLSYMLSNSFLNGLKKTNEQNEFYRTLNDASGTQIDDGDECLVNECVIRICQILCFPFAIDANEELITRTYKIIKEFNLFNKVLSASMLNTLESTEIPIGLLSRLILTDEDLVQLMIDQLLNSPQVNKFFKFK
jgi:hypothetical protein